MASDGGFAYTLTLCRPRVRTAAKRLFAELECGSEKCQVNSWPCLSIPFQLRRHDTLVIRVFQADNLDAFAGGERENIGYCKVPLAELPETPPFSTAPSAELWLYLGDESLAQNHEAFRAGPRICLLLHPKEDMASALIGLYPGTSATVPQEVSPAPAIPEELASPASESPVQRWQAKFKHEQQRTQELEQESDTVLRVIQSEADKLGRKLEAVLFFAARRTLECQAAMCFDAWCEWVAREKSERQFDQLSEDLEHFSILQQSTMSELAVELAHVERQLKQVKLKERSQQEHWEATLARIESQLVSEEEQKALAACFSSWTLACEQKAWVLRMQKAYHDSGSRELLFVPLAAWCSLLGDQTLNSLMSRYDDTKEETWKRAKSMASSRIDALPTLLAGNSPGETFMAWWRLAKLRSSHYHQACRLAQSVERLHAADVALASYCISMWHGLSSKPEVRIAAQQAARKMAMDRRRMLTAVVFEGVCAGPEAAHLHFALMSWKYVVEQYRLQRHLEEHFAEKELSQGHLGQQQQELEDIQRALSQEEERWEAERADLLERLHHLEAELQEGERQLHEVAQQRIQAEVKKLEQQMRADGLQKEVDEIRKSELEAINEAGRLAAEEIDAERRQMEDDFQSETAAAGLVIEKLRQEAAASRERHVEYTSQSTLATEELPPEMNAKLRELEQLRYRDKSAIEKLQLSEASVEHLEKEIALAQAQQNGAPSPARSAGSSPRSPQVTRSPVGRPASDWAPGPLARILGR